MGDLFRDVRRLGSMKCFPSDGAEFVGDAVIIFILTAIFEVNAG